LQEHFSIDYKLFSGPFNAPLLLFIRRHLGRDSNNAAGRTTASVSSLLGISVSSLAQIIGTIVDDNSALRNGQFSLISSRRKTTYANDALSTNQFDKIVGYTALGNSVGISLDVTQVTDVTLRVRWSTVFLVVWVDYAN
jgi:hypothetical protein